MSAARGAGADGGPGGAEPGSVTQCATCGVERAEPLPEVCPICADERQYVPVAGQRWTTPEQSRAAGASIEFTERETDVIGLEQKNCPGIGQRPSLIRTDHGNVLVEVPNYISDEAVAAIRGWGGLSAIIASHPHMYGLQSLWSAAFDHCPVYVSAPDEQWLGLRPRNTIVWGGGHAADPADGGEIEILPGVRASQPGGHFPGSVVVHWTAPDGRGVLFSGDTIGTVADREWVTFMRSFPNWMPLSGAVVRRIADHISRYDFDRLYSNFGGCVPRDARAAVQRSAERYAAWVDGEYDHLT